MKIIKKVDWSGLLFFVNTIIMITTGIYNLNNLVSCYETINYQVWICNQSISYWIFHICSVIWIIWMGILLIELFCIKWDIKNIEKGNG